MSEESVEKYCLKWNEYESNLSSSFRTLLEERQLFDVTLVCQDNTQIQAHRVRIYFIEADVYQISARANTGFQKGGGV